MRLPSPATKLLYVGSFVFSPLVSARALWPSIFLALIAAAIHSMVGVVQASIR